MAKPKKILVTGGFGFIGSYVVDELLNRGMIPIVYDNHFFANQKRFEFSYEGLGCIS